MNWTTVYFLAGLIALSGACNSGKEEASGEEGEEFDMKATVDEAGVEFARKQLADLDKRLASDDPGSASSICSVIATDMPAIEKADSKLAATLKRRCGRDVAVRSLEKFVKEAEAARAASPDDKFLMECSSFSIYMKPVKAAGADQDPEVAKLHGRFAKACPGKE